MCIFLFQHQENKMEEFILNLTRRGATSWLEGHEDYPEIIVVICYLIVFSVAGTIGNAFVIYVFSKKRDKSTSTIFILALAGTDFLTCLVIIPYTMAYEIYEKKVKYDLVCKIYQFFITSNVPFSAFIMVAIAMDRYFKICRPWTHYMDPKCAKKIIIVLLSFTFTFGVITALAHGVYREQMIELVIANTTTYMPSNTTYNSYNIPLISTPSIAISDMRFSNMPLANISNEPVERQFYSSLIYTGECSPNECYITKQFRVTYQKIYASFFLLCFTMVSILYGLIYRSIATRRSQKAQRSLLNGLNNRRTSAATHTVTNPCTVTTRLTTAENGEVETVKEPVKTQGHIPIHKKRQSRYKSIRDKHRVANVKTAGILFIVTAVFIISFLPAWLMATGCVGGNIIIFYMYFTYNVANPIIYAFFNESFRSEMKKVFHC